MTRATSKVASPGSRMLCRSRGQAALGALVEGPERDHQHDRPGERRQEAVQDPEPEARERQDEARAGDALRAGAARVGAAAPGSRATGPGPGRATTFESIARPSTHHAPGI